jgi:intracellular sulfur oxidation DsrE/DsrF family protein
MTVDEKKAIQTVLIDEITQHLQDQPTMLVDALLADQGYAFLEQLLRRRAQQASQLAQMTLQLHRALNGMQPPNTLALPRDEQVA